MSKKAQFEGPSVWETMDWDALAGVRQKAFERQWAYLWERSPFYQKKLLEAGFRAELCPDLNDLSELPFTWKQDFRESLDRAPPLGEHLAADIGDIRQIQTSSGTTGRPMAIALTEADARLFSEILARGYHAVGMRASDTILHAFSMSRGWIGGLCMVEGYLHLGATVLPIGAEAGRDKIIELMQIFRPSALCATPGFLLALGQRAQELGIDPASLGVRHMLTGGEPGGGVPSVRENINRMWGGRVRETMGGTDVTPICWGECPAETGMHFLAPESVWFEIVDPETGKVLPLEVGTVGEVVYTHLAREAVPILRFRHRDIVQVTAWHDCECGRKTPQIRCIGRADDMLIVRGVNLFPSAIRALLSELDGAGPEFRIVKPRGQYTLPGPLRVKVEVGPEFGMTREQLAHLMHQRLSIACDVELVPMGATTSANAHKSSYFEEY